MYAGASRYFVGTRQAYIFMPERAAASKKKKKHEFQFQGLTSCSPCCSVCFTTCFTVVSLVEIAGERKMKPSL